MQSIGCWVTASGLGVCYGPSPSPAQGTGKQPPQSRPAGVRTLAVMGPEMQSVSLSHHWLPQFLLVHPVVALGKDSQDEVAAVPPVPLTSMVQTQGDLSVLLEVPSLQCLGVRSIPQPPLAQFLSGECALHNPRSSVLVKHCTFSKVTFSLKWVLRMYFIILTEMTQNPECFCLGEDSRSLANFCLCVKPGSHESPYPWD